MFAFSLHRRALASMGIAPEIIPRHHVPHGIRWGCRR
jgi:hypothetical protein